MILKMSQIQQLNWFIYKERPKKFNGSICYIIEEEMKILEFVQVTNPILVPYIFTVGIFT